MIIGIYIQILIFLFVKPEINYSNFEGIVEYQIIYPDQGGSISPGVPQKFVIYFKNGNIRKEYRDLHDSLIFYSIYFQGKYQLWIYSS